MAPLQAWLDRNGLEALGGAFLAHGVSFEQLLLLADTDLRELGLSVGDRLRFRAALAKDPPPASAERRPLTIVFVDLVGSSRLAERLPQEDQLELLRLYRDCAGAAIQHFGGHVARHVGDGILAYFGYRMAHENDPERAVRAALAVARAVADLKTPAKEPLAVRIGIATGQVVIGDLIAGGAADRDTVVGPIPNLAQRMQTLAPPGGVVIGADTHARVHDLFACADLGAVDLAGFAERQRAWRVLHELPRVRRRVSGGPLQSRDTERARLAALWASARAGQGRAALVAGEAGIGKSCLVQTFVSGVLPDARVVLFAASPFDTDSTLRPFADWLREEPAVPASVTAALLPDAAAADLPSDAAEHQRRIEAWANHLLGLADDGPVCLVMEDLHWLDPSSLDVLRRVARRVPDRPMLLLMTSRPVKGLPEEPELLTLDRLPEDAVAAIVADLSAGTELPAELVAGIVARAEGMPLFAAELTRAVLGSVGDGKGVDHAAAVPAGLREALMARLDRAGTAKQVALAASVIGRAVTGPLLAAVCRRTQDELAQPLAALARAGVLEPDPQSPDAGYVFGHALLRDAAYESLTRDVRQDLHGRTAEALAALAPDTARDRPELLALHLTEAGRGALAVAHWLEAGRRGLGRGALLEATRLLRRALDALDRADEGAATREAQERRLEILSLLGPACISLHGPKSAETQQVYSEAFELAQQLPESTAHFPVYWGWWRISADHNADRERAATLVRRAERVGDPGLRLQAHHCSWASHFCCGELTPASRHIAQGLILYGDGDWRDHARLYGNHDARVCGHGNLAQILWMQGRSREALEQTRHASAWAEEIDHLGSRLHALEMRLLHAAFRRDALEVEEQARLLAQFARDHGIADQDAKARIFQGWALARNSEAVAGMRMLREGLDRQGAIGTDEDFPIYETLLAELLIASGRADEAMAKLAARRAVAEPKGLRIWLPEVVRLQGEAAAALGKGPDAALALIDEAAAIAAEQGAAMLGLRAALSAARVLHRAGDVAIAAVRLRDALDAVAADGNDADVREALALLGTLPRAASAPVLG